MTIASFDRRKPFRLMYTPRPCLRTPRPPARVLRGACSEAAGWAAWHRLRHRIDGQTASAGVYRLMGPTGEMSRVEVLPVMQVMSETQVMSVVSVMGCTTGDVEAQKESTCPRPPDACESAAMVW